MVYFNQVLLHRLHITIPTNPPTSTKPTPTRQLPCILLNRSSAALALLSLSILALASGVNPLISSSLKSAQS